MGLLNKKPIDPKLAEDIENDMAELDNSPRRGRKSSVKSVDCPDCSNSLIGPGLLDAFTRCPTCKGTGKVATLD